ncbi:MAG: hypothetical protein FWE85_02650, partial [Clostridiales bacterium]|nr:hypothetical protein [Clostridiales bacterium]
MEVIFWIIIVILVIYIVSSSAKKKRNEESGVGRRPPPRPDPAASVMKPGRPKPVESLPEEPFTAEDSPAGFPFPPGTLTPDPVIRARLVNPADRPKPASPPDMAQRRRHAPPLDASKQEESQPVALLSALSIDRNSLVS